MALKLDRTSTFWIDPSTIMDEHLKRSLARPQSDSIADSWVVLWDVQSVRMGTAMVRLIGVAAESGRSGSTKMATHREASPILLQVKPDCTFGKIGAPKDTHPALMRDWQSLLTLVEFKWPRGSGDSWNSVQTDTTGEYAAEYQRQSTRTLERTRTHFVSTIPPRPGIQAKASILASTGSASRENDGGWFTELEVHEHVQVDIIGAGKFADVKTTVSLQSIPLPTHDFWDEVVDQKLVSWTETHDLTNTNESNLRFSGDPIDPALVALDLDKLVGVFGGLLAEDRVGAFRILVHWLRHDPTRAQALLKSIRMGEIPKDLHDEMFHALGLAGGPEARTVLLEAATSKDLSTANHLQALAALKDMPKVSGDTVTFLDSQWQGRSNPPSLEERAALLTAGSLLDRPDTPKGLREELEQTLNAALADASNSAEISAVLGAIGNTHDPEYANQVLPLLNSDNDQTKIAALETLTRIGSAPAPDEALEALTELPTKRGQDYASDALKQRAEDATDEDIQWAIFLLNEPETIPFRRGAIIQFLGALSNRPLARQGLIDWFPFETEPELLRLIGRYIPAEDLP
jgi:hypothetical protein